MVVCSDADLDGDYVPEHIVDDEPQPAGYAPATMRRQVANTHLNTNKQYWNRV
jgi:hypothetical protein